MSFRFRFLAARNSEIDWSSYSTTGNLETLVPRMYVSVGNKVFHSFNHTVLLNRKRGIWPIYESQFTHHNKKGRRTWLSSIIFLCIHLSDVAGRTWSVRWFHQMAHRRRVIVCQRNPMLFRCKIDPSGYFPFWWGWWTTHKWRWMGNNTATYHVRILGSDLLGTYVIDLPVILHVGQTDTVTGT